jgi:hypothetical protein
MRVGAAPSDPLTETSDVASAPAVTLPTSRNVNRCRRHRNSGLKTPRHFISTGVDWGRVDRRPVTGL